MTRRKSMQHVVNIGTSVILAVLSVLLVVYGILPGIESIKSYYVDIKELTKQNDAIKGKISFLSGLDEDTLSRQMQSLVSAVPPDKSFQTFMSLIDTVSTTAKLTVTDITISNPGSLSSESAKITDPNMAKLGSNTIKGTINTSGTLEQTLTFLNTVNAVRRLVRIVSLNLAFTSDAPERSIVSSRFDLEAFYAPLPKTLGKSTDQLEPLTSNEESLITKVDQLPMANIPNDLQSTQLNESRIDPFLP